MSRLIVKNLPKNTSEAQLRAFFSAKGEVTDIKQLKDSEGNFKSVAFIGFRESGQEETLMQYFNKNYIGGCKILVEPAKSTADTSIKKWSKKPTTQEYPSKPLPEDLDSTRLYLRNLPYSVTKEDLQELFAQHGEIEELHLPIDSKSHRPKGFAYVKYRTTESAVTAFDKLDRSVFQGRLLHIIPAAKKPEPVSEIKAKSSYKHQLGQELKKRAKNSNTWNTLFVNSDTVASAMSEKLHMTKGEFLDKDNTDLAVRVSMAETKILEEIRDWMKNHDINFEAFSGDRNSTPRSQEIIIVKNLAKGAVLSEINDLFSRYGSVCRCIMPPSKTMAIVEFRDLASAKNAFDKISYTTYRALPLYLEWAPQQTFDAPHQEIETVTTTNANTIFVKNLSFKTTQEALKIHFEASGKVKSAKIIMNKGLPCGYGFVEFNTEKEAGKALRNLNNSLLDGHALKLSESKTSVAVPKKRQRSPERQDEEVEDLRSKLLVKNLPFEANTTELKEMFQNFGELKTVRIPTKASGGHRGFGFVEFLSHEEAEAALKSLQNTHFYGRRLVIDWAKEESTLSALKQKAS